MARLTGTRDGVDVVIELDGAWVAPAFVDAHVHTTATGLHLMGLDLSGASGADDLLSRVASAATDHAGSVLSGPRVGRDTWPNGNPHPPATRRSGAWSSRLSVAS